MKAYFEKPLSMQSFPIRCDGERNANFQFPNHWHKEVEIIYISSGEMLIVANEKKFLLSEGDIMLIGVNQVHSYIGNVEGVYTLSLIDFGKLEDLNKDIASYKKLFSILHGNHHIKKSQNSKLCRALRDKILESVSENINQDIGYRYKILSNYYELMTLLIREFSTNQNTKIDSYEKTLKKSQFLKTINEYIDQNYQKEILLEDISSIAGYSIYYFTRVFREYTGTTFKKYLNLYRLDIARNLLIEEEIPIIDIAYKSGFNSIKTFNRVFKEHVGCSPSEYKKAIFEV